MLGKKGLRVHELENECKEKQAKCRKVSFFKFIFMGCHWMVWFRLRVGLPTSIDGNMKISCSYAQLLGF